VGIVGKAAVTRCCLSEAPALRNAGPRRPPPDRTWTASDPNTLTAEERALLFVYSSGHAAAYCLGCDQSRQARDRSDVLIRESEALLFERQQALRAAMAKRTTS